MRGLQEVVPIQDTLVHGIGAIEHLEGGLIRFWLYVLQETEDATDPAEKVVVAKIVGPTTGLAEALQQIVGSIAPRALSMVPLVTGLMLN